MGAFLAGMFMQPRQLRGSSFAAPPRTILICGAQDYACNAYVVTYHPAAHAYRNSQGGGAIDYERKTISIVWSNDQFKNVETLEREVFLAALWERGIRDTGKRDVHDWLDLSDRIIASLFHDNPDFANYVSTGY